MIRRRRRQTMITAAIVVMIPVVMGCAPSRQEQLQIRLERFRQVLPESARRAFDAQRYEAAVFQIDSALAVDPGFAARWEEMKKAEAIGLFSTTEVVHYFVIYFVSYKGVS